MKLICEGLELSDAVLKVIKATASKTTNPILEGIKLRAGEDTLTLSATDLELSIEKTIPADVKIEGEVVVPGKFFAEFVKKLSNEQIELTLEGKNQIKIEYTDSEGYLQCMNNDEFPQIKELENPEKVVLKNNDFKDLINKAKDFGIYLIFGISLNFIITIPPLIMIQVHIILPTGHAQHHKYY